jgi:hypothetical protein
MANKLFENFPTIPYRLSDGRLVTIKDFFRKARISSFNMSKVIDYEYYELSEGDRPDVVASKLYGDGDLHWVLFLVNDIENYYDWFMSSESFEQHIDSYYKGQYLTFATTEDVVQYPNYDSQGNLLNTRKYILGEKVTTAKGTGHILEVDPLNKRVRVERGLWEAGETLVGLNKSSQIVSVIEPRDVIVHYENSEGIKTNVPTSGFSSVSLWQNEFNKNEEKRKIKIVKPSSISRVINEFERLMSI